MMMTLKPQATFDNIVKHTESCCGRSTCSTPIPGGVNSERECRMGSRVIETEVEPSEFSPEECQSFNAQTGSAVCAVCHRCPAIFMCDSCEQNICESCTGRSSMLPLSRFCSDECKSEAETAAEQIRDSDPHAQRR